MTDIDDLMTRYLAVWNEADEATRHNQIPEIWAVEGNLYNGLREYHGHAGIEHATKRSSDLFLVRGYTFRPRHEVATHHDAIRFDWEMLDPAGRSDTLGTQFMVLDHSGLIRLDYQFIKPGPEVGRERASPA